MISSLLPASPSSKRLVARPHVAPANVHAFVDGLLLRRTYGVDALRCPKCTARMRVMATAVEPGVVKEIVAHRGLPTEPLPRGRARDPTGQQSFDFDAA